MTSNNFSIYQAINYAFKTYFKNWHFFGMLLLIIFLITFGFEFFKISLASILFDPIYLIKREHSYRNLLQYRHFIWIAYILFIVLYFAFLNNLFLNNYDHPKFKLKRFNIGKFIPQISTSLIYYLSFLALASGALIIDWIANSQPIIWFYQAILLGIGFLALLLPAVIFASKYLFSDYFSLEKNLNIVESLNESSNPTHGKTTKIVLLFYVIGIISYISFVILGGLFFFTYTSAIIKSPAGSLVSHPTDIIMTPVRAFYIFLLYGFIIPLIFLMKLHIYKQLTTPK